MHTRMVWSSQLLVLALVFCATVSQTFGAQVNFRWCCKETAEMDKCKKFKDVLPMIAKAAGVDREIKPDCVDGKTAMECMKKIANGEADLITLDGGEVYAGKTYNLVPVVYEDYGSGTGKSYTAVAVAKANNTGLNLGNLKGKKSCHTGYRKTAGYNVPVGHLLERKIMEREDCGINGTAKSVSMFFSKSCIPGSTPAEFPNLCELCPGKNCKAPKNKYAGYAGAFKCLAEGAGDVAFIKHVTVGEEVAKNSSYGNMSDYVYLCPDNTNKVVTADSYKTCSLAQVPSHVVMTKESKENVALFQKVLVKASELCQGNVSKTNCSDFKIFESTSQHSNLLFKDSTKKLVAVGDKETWQTWLTEKYMKTLMGLEDPCVEPSRAAFLAPGLTIALFLCGSLLMLFT